MLSVCNLLQATRTHNLVLRKKRHIATMNILTVKIRRKKENELFYCTQFNRVVYHFAFMVLIVMQEVERLRDY